MLVGFDLISHLLRLSLQTVHQDDLYALSPYTGTVGRNSVTKLRISYLDGAGITDFKTKLVQAKAKLRLRVTSDKDIFFNRLFLCKVSRLISFWDRVHLSNCSKKAEDVLEPHSIPECVLYCP